MRRDMAVVRAAGCVIRAAIVLGVGHARRSRASATSPAGPLRRAAPAGPPWRRSHAGESQRSISGATPPARGRWLSPPVVEAMTETLAAGEQALLFLNRRGYAPLTLCRACGHGMRMSAMLAWLVEHRLRRRLHLPPLRLRRAARRMPELRRRRSASSPAAPGVERLAEEVDGAAARGAARDLDLRQPAGPSAAAAAGFERCATARSTS